MPSFLNTSNEHSKYPFTPISELSVVSRSTVFPSMLSSKAISTVGCPRESRPRHCSNLGIALLKSPEIDEVPYVGNPSASLMHSTVLAGALAIEYSHSK